MATANPGKIKEINDLMNGRYEFLSLQDIGCTEDIPETADTIEGNALQKAMYVFEKYGYDCFAEDTGLEVDALNGAPGVHTGRYAGEHKSTADNIRKLMTELHDKPDRKARFKTVIALISKGQTYTFEGICEGRIAASESGSSGFGYDPVFIPDGYSITFAEMDKETKNAISHRGKAIMKLKEKLE